MKLVLLNLLLVGLSVYINFSKANFVALQEGLRIGVASSAYQIEGGWNADGKEMSIWDTYTHNHPEIILDGSNGDVSADSYHFFNKDIEAIKEVGFQFYRFSISWPRVMKNATFPNLKGLEYYDKIIDSLLENNIEPIITMYHWDLPQFLQDFGGFANPLIVDYFKLYSDVIFEHFGDRVKKWITFNEPHNFCLDGYGIGINAPGLAASGVGEYLCAHYVLQSHAAAFHLYKEKYFEKQKGEIGISLVSRFFYPKDETVDQSLVERIMQFRLGWFANPIYTKDGDYPSIMIDVIGNKSKAEGRPWSRLPKMSEEMRKSLIGSADFFALNYYTSRIIKPRVETLNETSFESDTGTVYLTDQSWLQGKSRWLFSVPEGLHDVLQWIKEKYDNPKVMISENGFSDEGELEDDTRINYFKDHLTSVIKARRNGCNVVSYTAWSIIDNFEWAKGYTEKFGIFSVNMTSDQRERTPKKSALFFKHLIANQTMI